METVDAVQPVQPPQKKRLLIASFAAVALLLVLGIVWLYNFQIAQKPLDRVLLDDPRNQVVSAKAHLADWIDTDTLQFDLTGVSGQATRMDVFRLFLQYAKAQQGHRFQKVLLSYKGKRKFYVPGDYFQQLGREYDTQNPVYTMRTFPEHIFTPDGRRAFESYEGGWLGVLAKEMERFSKFHDQWYLDDMRQGR